MALVNSTVGADLVRAGIFYEALVRSEMRTGADLVRLTTGCHTKQQRWEASERARRDALAPDRSLPARRAPSVFWHGPDRATGRPVVVLVNGWTASGEMWPTRLVARLEQHFDVVRIDNRGSGYSRTAPAPFTLGQMADDVRDVLDVFGAREAIVVGLSMGGMIAQELAITHPDVVARLVLCGTRPPIPVGFSPAPSLLTTLISSPGPGEHLGRFLKRMWGSVTGPGFADEHPEQMRELIQSIRQRPTPRAGVLNQMRAIAAWSGDRRLARINAPTVVVHGTDDPLIPVGNGMRLAQLIAGAAYIELPGVGHLVPYEAPDAVLAAIGAS